VTRTLARRESIRNPHDPVVATKCDKTECNSFIESGRRHLDRMSDAIQVRNRDAAGASGHNDTRLAYSLFIRHGRYSARLKL